MVGNPMAGGRDAGVTVPITAQDEFTGKVDGMIGSLDRFNKKALAVAGGGIAALGAAVGVDAVNAASSFESAMKDLEKVAGEDVASGLEDPIQQMAEDIPLTAEQLAGLATEAARFGVKGQENIQRFVESASKMSTATTLSTEQSAEAFAKLSKLTGTPIEDVENLGSSINELSNNYATSSQEIVDSSLRSAGALSQLGMSETEIMGISAAVNEVSESSERAGTRLRRLAQEMMDAEPEKFAGPLDMTAKQFETMREEDPHGLLQRMAKVMADGGESADALRENLSTTSRQALAGMAQNLEGVTTANEMANESFREATSLQEEFETEMEKTGSQQQTLSSQINNIQRDLGEELLPTFKSAIGVVSDAVDRFSEMNQATDGALAKFSVVGAVVGGSILALGSFAAMISGPVMGSVTALAGAIPSLGGVIAALTGPVGIAIGAAALLAAAWTNNWGDIQGKTGKAIDYVKKTIRRGLRRIRKWWDKNGDHIVASARSAFNRARVAIHNAVSYIKRNVIRPFLSTMTRLWEIHGEDLVSESRATFSRILAIISPLVDALWFDVIQPTLTQIRKFWSRHGDRILSISQTAFDNILLVIGGTLDAVLSVIRAGMAVMRGDFGSALSIIEGMFGRQFGRIKAIISNTIEIIKETMLLGINWLKNTAPGMMHTAIGAIVGVIKAPFEALYEWIFGNSLLKDLINDPAEWIKSTGKKKIGDAFGQLVEAIKAPFSGLSLSIDWPSLPGWLQDAMDKAGGGLQAAVEYVQSLDAGGSGGTSGGGGDDDDDSSYYSGRGGGGGGGGGDDDDDESSGGCGSDSDCGANSICVNGECVHQGYGGTVLDTGGYVEETGMALIHAGERVIPDAQVSERGGIEAGTKTQNFDITVYAEDGTDFGRKLKRELRMMDV